MQTLGYGKIGINDRGLQIVVVWISFLMLAGTGILGVSSNAKSAPVMLFTDDFDSYPVGAFPPNWQLIFGGAGGSQQYVTNTVASSAPNSFHLLASPGGCWSAMAGRPVTSSAPIIGFRAKVLIDQLNLPPGCGSGSADVAFSHPYSVYGGHIATVAFQTNGIVIAGNGYILPLTAQEDTWYDIIVELDRPSNLMHVWINGVDYGQFQAHADPNKVYQITKFTLQAGHTFTHTYFDDVEVWEGPYIPPLNIDIKPGSYPNTINMKSKGKIPVAILSSEGFDAPAEIDPTSPTFGRTGNEKSLFKCTGPEDVNGDGLLDLVCHFYTQKTGFQEGDTEGILKALGYDGTSYEGRDSVRILPGGGWAISVKMRYIDRTYSSLVMQARTEDTLYRWGSDGFYSSLFLDEWNLAYTERYYVEWFGNWSNSDSDWHTFGMIADGNVLELVLDGTIVKTYEPERPITELQAAMVRPGWITTSEVDRVTAENNDCDFIDQMSYSTVEDAEAGGWVVLQGRHLISGTGTSLIMDNTGGVTSLIERPLACT